MGKTYTVMYRTGGTLNFQWRRVGERFSLHATAAATAASLERMGYPTLIEDYEKSLAIGLPEMFSGE